MFLSFVISHPYRAFPDSYEIYIVRVGIRTFFSKLIYIHFDRSLSSIVVFIFTAYFYSCVKIRENVEDIHPVCLEFVALNCFKLQIFVLHPSILYRGLSQIPSTDASMSPRGAKVNLVLHLSLERLSKE